MVPSLLLPTLIFCTIVHLVLLFYFISLHHVLLFIVFPVKLLPLIFEYIELLLIFQKVLTLLFQLAV